MKNKSKYLIIAGLTLVLLLLTSCGGSGAAKEYRPIQGWELWSWDFLVWPMASLMYGVGKVIPNYGIVIIVTTIVVRTLAWPIYAKTNDMSLKMQLMGPEQAKIEAKYAGKADQESAQRKQMEMMQLYKKHGVGIAGCLLPVIQFPIFLSFYETLQRVPKTRGAGFALDFSFLSGSFFGVDLFSGRLNEAGEVISTTQNWGIIVLAAVVGITQFLSQILMTKRQKKAKEDAQSSVPTYRQPPQTDMQKQTETTMKIMMYGMIVMMVFFVYRSTAALGLYWLVGNIYTTLQGYIGHKRSKKRMETLKSKM